MSAGIEPTIASLESRYYEVGRHLHYTAGHLTAAGTALKAGNTGNAGYFLEEAGADLETTANDFYAMTESIWVYSIALWRWVDENWPTDGNGYVLTAKAICEAWAADDFKDRALTIAFIDRMRQLIWDEPFYVAWAARPE